MSSQTSAASARPAVVLKISGRGEAGLQTLHVCDRERGEALTVSLRVVGPGLSVGEGGLARELLLEVSAEAGREAV